MRGRNYNRRCSGEECGGPRQWLVSTRVDGLSVAKNDGASEKRMKPYRSLHHGEVIVTPIKAIQEHIFAVEPFCVIPHTVNPVSDYDTAPTGEVYLPNSFSIAPTTSFESGVTAGSKRCTTLPLRSTRNLVKFHLI